jgi:hypothetical protein
MRVAKWQGWVDACAYAYMLCEEGKGNPNGRMNGWMDGWDRRKLYT